MISWFHRRWVACFEWYLEKNSFKTLHPIDHIWYASWLNLDGFIRVSFSSWSMSMPATRLIWKLEIMLEIQIIRPHHRFTHPYVGFLPYERASQTTWWRILFSWWTREPLVQIVMERCLMANRSIVSFSMDFNDFIRVQWQTSPRFLIPSAFIWRRELRYSSLITVATIAIFPKELAERGK